MTREDIIRMAQECNLIGMRPYLDGIYQESIERFAALVAAAAKADEREACAKVLDEMAAQDKRSNYYQVAAAAIRLRSSEH